jgi:hypothetical protein
MAEMDDLFLLLVFLLGFLLALAIAGLLTALIVPGTYWESDEDSDDPKTGRSMRDGDRVLWERVRSRRR